MNHDALAMTEYRDEPAILVFADSEAALERARRAGEQAGCRVAGATHVEAAIDRLDRQVSMDTVLVDLESQSPSQATLALLDRLQDEAAARDRTAVVAFPLALIDAVAARTPHRHIQQLCDSTQAQRAAAVALAASRPPPRFHDGGRETHGLLHELSEEVGRIAHILATMADEEGEAGSAARLGTSEGDEAGIDAGQLRAMIRARRLRDQYFRGGLFADPAWDMLLDLMAARIERNRVAVSSLCIAAAVPATTALRWIKALTDRGLFVRCADPQDGRRVYIELSDDTARTLAAYLKAAQRIAPAVI